MDSGNTPMGIRRHYDPDSEFFLEGNYERYNHFRVYHTENENLLCTEEMKITKDTTSSQLYQESFKCNEMNCNQYFSSIKQVIY